jgi:hypothetical protein
MRPPFVEQATIAGGGVIPHIHKSLINKNKKKKNVIVKKPPTGGKRVGKTTAAE